MAVKTDNSNLAAKLQLRRYFLGKYHAQCTPRVLDCCQGEGVLWRRLCQEFVVESYWGLDLKKKKGRLTLDSVRVLQQSGWKEDVIDIDTYGSPWKHWEALLPNLRHPATVFLTIGVVRMGGGGGLGRAESCVLDLGKLRVPPGISGSLHELALGHMLTKANDFDIRLIEAVEAVSAGSARYIGVRLEPVSENRLEAREAQREQAH